MNRHPSLFSLLFLIFFNLPSTTFSVCSLDFSKFLYEPGSECFGVAPTPFSCCHLALRPLFEAMTIEANRSGDLFLDPVQAQECATQFQALHPRINLTICGFQKLLTSPLPLSSKCSENVDRIETSLGNERLAVLRSSCRDLSTGNYSEDACFTCAGSYRSSLQFLEEGNSGSGSSGSSMCGGALLIALASSDVGSLNRIQGLFTCLWDEIHYQGVEKHRKGKRASLILILLVIIGALSLVILALILYKVTRTRLRIESQKEIDDLSVTVRRKSMEYEKEIPFSFSRLYVFSHEEIARATDNFNSANLIGEGNTGKIYLGTMPSGQKVAVKRIREEQKVSTFATEINHVSKIRHPNLVSILGYCNRREHCLVSEYLVNSSLANWLLGNQDSPVLTWDQRLQIAVGIVRGLWFLHNYPTGPIVHCDLKLTNILLDDKLEAKLLNYGLSKQGYYHETPRQAILANDVYNCGIVLLQLLTGRRMIDQNPAGPLSLLMEARNILERGENTSTLVDPRLNGYFNILAFEHILRMVVHCTSVLQDERPSLEEILQKLKEAQNLAKHGGSI